MIENLTALKPKIKNKTKKMEFIANGINNSYPKFIMPPAGAEVDRVLAAIAYGSSSPNPKEDFIAHCVKNKYRLDIWMRYDHTVPVATSLLWRIYRHQKDNIFCKLIPDSFHSKVIWWKGYGAYIGSANLSDRAWNSNIEAGLFLTEDELNENLMHIQLEKFFDELKSLDESYNLSETIIKEQEAIERARADSHNLGRALRTIPEWGGLLLQEGNSELRRRNRFKREWNETLGYLENIGLRLKEFRPVWIPEDTPINWQVDQFLHAYYFNEVGDPENPRKKPYEEFHSKNQRDPNTAVTQALVWWQKTLEAPSSEEITLFDSAPALQKYLSRDNIKKLTVDQFTDVCRKTHATKDHVSKIKLDKLGIHDIKSMSVPERLPIFAEWLLSKRNTKGWNVLELLDYVLYGGLDKDMPDRLFNAYSNEEYAIPHYGLNSIAELIGWVRPEVAPPRNGRTSKALKALGYDVETYS